MGRPPLPKGRKRTQIGVRVSPELHHLLLQDAQRNQRSIGKEAEFRLMRTFDHEGIVAAIESYLAKRD